MSQPAHRYFVFDTVHGFCAIAWNGVGISRLQLPAPAAAATEHNLRRRLANAEPGTPAAELIEVVEAVRRYFRGELMDFSTCRLDLDGQDEFFRRTYQAARRVAWGQTTTYGTLAKELGAGPEAARTVGQAMAKNPVPLIIPCHRVLAAGGKLGGFSAPGGLDTKLHMLALEGIEVGPAPSPQQSLAW